MNLYKMFAQIAGNPITITPPPPPLYKCMTQSISHQFCGPSPGGAKFSAVLPWRAGARTPLWITGIFSEPRKRDNEGGK